MLLRPHLLIPALALAAAWPAAARADTFCAGTPGCDNPSVQVALDAAKSHPGHDVVELGAGTFTAVGGFRYDTGAATNPVEIVGQGPATVLRAQAPAPSGSLTSLLVASPGSVVRDLAVAVPDPGKASPESAIGVSFDGVVARRVAVTRAPDLQGVGAEASRSTLEAVDVDGGKVGVQGTELAISDGRISGRIAVMIHSSTEASAIARSRIEGGWKGISTGALVTVRDTLVRTSSTGTALEALASSTAASVDARHVTVVGPGTGVGALVMTSWDKDATVTLSNSVVSGFSTAGQSLQYYGTGARVVAVYRSVLPPGGPVKYVEETEVLRLADPGFADPAAGDFTLMPGSPALDFAAPMLPGGLAAKDLLGRARPADGDGDGTALPDPGAFERPAPGGGGDAGGGGETGTGGETAPPGGDVVAPAVTGLRVTLGARPRARFALSEPAQVAVTLARRRNGRFRTLTTITRAKAGGEVGVRLPRRLVRRSGRYRVALLATDAAANVSPTARTRFRVR